MRAFIGTKNGEKIYISPKDLNKYSDWRIDYRDVLESEIEELNIPTEVYTIRIPINVYLNNDVIGEKIRIIELTFNELCRTCVGDWLFIGNIPLDYIQFYLTKSEYKLLKDNGTIFPQEIIDIYENEENEEDEEDDE